MIAEPLFDEAKVINTIGEVNGHDYALERMTFTMIDKNNIDANSYFRAILQNHHIVNYEELPHGGKNGVQTRALFVCRGCVEEITMNFYRVNNNRGDRRYSIYGIKGLVNSRRINEGDLLYYSITEDAQGKPQVFIVNLTHNVPAKEDLLAHLSLDPINRLFAELQPKLQDIITGRKYYENSKGRGKIAPKDVGDTLEAILGVDTNNRNNADIDGLIEIKSKASKGTLDTLFTLRPNFDGTRVAEYEPVDRNRVSAVARLYGYDSDKHVGYSSLYVTMGPESAPQNNQGFFLRVDDENEVINMIKKDVHEEVVAYWTFSDLRDALLVKHPATLWVKADQVDEDGMVKFRYNEIEFTRSPQFATFISMVKAGKITYDWRGYTTKSGKYSGKNHGNAWRIKPSMRPLLFGHSETIEF